MQDKKKDTDVYNGLLDFGFQSIGSLIMNSIEI